MEKENVLRSNIFLCSILDAVCDSDCKTLHKLISDQRLGDQDLLRTAMVAAVTAGLTECVRLLLVRQHNYVL